MGSSISSLGSKLSSSLVVFKGETSSATPSSQSLAAPPRQTSKRFSFTNSFSKKKPAEKPELVKMTTIVASGPSVVFTPGVSLGINAKLKYASAPMGKDYDMSLLASLGAQEQEEKAGEDQRNPIDLVIVLDRSGSMSGSKLDLCKETLRFLLDKGLTDKDFLAIVTFDTSVRVDYQGGKMTAENKARVEDIVNRIQAGSSTNLSDGLFQGLEVLSRGSTAEVSAVCILTDGLMNHGLTDPEELIRLTKEKLNGPLFAGKAKPSVFTFGYGVDVDSDMLKRLSEAGDGTFYRMENPESVPMSFADCLGGLTSVAAQGIELQCQLGEGVEFTSDPLTKYLFERTADNTYTVKIKDMYCGEQRDLIFQLKVKATASAEPVKIKVSCKFTDTIHEIFHTIECTREIQRYPGMDAPSGTPDVDVLRHLARFEATSSLEQAQALGRAGNIEGARKRLEQVMGDTTKELSSAGVNVQDDIMIAEIMRDMKTVQDSLTSREEYERRGSGLMSAAMQTHQYQRSNQVEEYLHSDEAVSKSAWAGASKKKMIHSSKAAFSLSSNHS